MTDHWKGGIIAVILLLLLGGATFGGYYFTRPKPVVETYTPEVKQPDGSIIVEKKPDAKAKPKMIVPKKAVVERTGEFTVQGKTPIPAKGMVCEKCPPVTVATTLIRNQDGSKSVVVKALDGVVLSAVDIPVETATLPPEPKVWAAGVAYNPVMQTMGVWVDRDVMRVRLGAMLNQSRLVRGGPTGTEAWLKLGMNF